MRCQYCNIDVSAGNMQEHVENVHKIKLFYCPNFGECQKSYKASKALDIHVRKSHPEKKDQGTSTHWNHTDTGWKCTDCQFTLPNHEKAYLDAHIHTVHLCSDGSRVVDAKARDISKNI